MNRYSNDGKIFVDMVGKNLPGDFVPFCDDFEVIRKTVNLLEGVEALDIVIHKSYADKPFTLYRKNLTSMKVMGEFLAHGLQILDTESNAHILLALVQEMEDFAPVRYFHEKAGFVTLKSGKTCFLGNFPIGLSGIEAESVLVKDDDMTPTGSKKAFRKLLLKDVAKRPELSIALTLAVTAPVAYLLKKAGVFTDLPIWVLVGHSSSGKSTSHYLQLGLFMNPMQGLRTFNSTENAFYAMQATQNGVPFVADDASHIPNFSIDSLLYTLPMGRKKERCQSNGELQPRVTFSGATIISSERSLLDRSSKNAGEVARVVEFTLPWTMDNLQADRIKEVCSNNYGWGTKPIISLLMSKGFDNKLVRKFKKTLKKLQEEKQPSSGVEARLLQRKVLILVSLWVAEKALKVGLHPEKVKLILDEVFEENLSEATVEIKDETEELLDDILAEVARNGSKFKDETDVASARIDISNNDLWGTKGFDGNDKALWILRPKFLEIIAKSKFGPRTAIKMLAAQNYLKTYSPGHYLFAKDIGLGEQKGYVLMLPKVKTALQEIFGMKKVRLIEDIEKKLMNDKLGIKNEYTGNLKNFKKMVDERPLALGFVRLGAQRVALILNERLKKALEVNVSEGFYIAPLQSLGTLILSPKEITYDCLKIVTHKSKDYIWCSNDRKKQAILSILGIELPNRCRMIFTDIAVEKNDCGIPYAVVNTRNKICTYVGDVNEDDPCEINDLFDNRAYLLGE